MVTRAREAHYSPRIQRVGKRFGHVTAIVALGLGSAATAASYRVPSEMFPTIQSAIDPCTEGDSVIVAPGRYSGPGNRDLRFRGADLILVSESGAAATTLDAGATFEYAHRVFHFEDRESRRAIAHQSGRSSAVDARTTRHEGYGISQRKRKLVEEIFGWTKTVGGLRKTRHRGRRRVGWVYLFTLAAHNLIRIPKLLGAV